VAKGATTTAVTSSVNSSAQGQPVTYTATVTATLPAAGTPTGTVQFFDGGTTITGCTAQTLNAADQATCTVTIYNSGAIHTITAQYIADSNFSGSTSAPLTQTVRGITINDSGQGHTDTLSGTTEENTGALVVNIYSGTGTTGTPVSSSTVPISGTSPPFTWTMTTGSKFLTAHAQYTAQAVQTDGSGNVTSSPALPFNAS
jgi:hypothetical protein